MSVRKQIDSLGNDVFNTANSPSIESPNLTFEEIYDDPLVVRSSNIKRNIRTKNSSEVGPVFGISLEDSKPLSPKEIFDSGNYIALASHRLSMAEGDYENVPYIYHGTYVMLAGDNAGVDPDDFPDQGEKSLAITTNYFCFVDETTLSRDMIIKKNSIVQVQIIDENKRIGIITHAQNLNIDYIINQTVSGGERLESTKQLFKGQSNTFKYQDQGGPIASTVLAGITPFASSRKLNKSQEKLKETLVSKNITNCSVKISMVLTMSQREGWVLGTNTRPIRNNNPGNIRYSKEATSEYGAVLESGSDPSFAKYPTLETGLTAMIDKIDKWASGNLGSTEGNKLVNYQPGNKPTIKEFIYTWAPPQDKNDPDSYGSKIVDGLNKDLGTNYTVDSVIYDILNTHCQGQK